MTRDIIIKVQENIMVCSIFYIRSKYNIMNKYRVFVEQLNYKVILKNKNSIFLSMVDNSKQSDVILLETNYIVFWNVGRNEIINTFNLINIGFHDNLSVHEDIYYSYKNENSNIDQVTNHSEIIIDKNIEFHQKNILSLLITIECKINTVNKNLDTSLKALNELISDLKRGTLNDNTIDDSFIYRLCGEVISYKKNLLTLKTSYLNYKIFLGTYKKHIINTVINYENRAMMKNRLNILQDKVTLISELFDKLNVIRQSNTLEKVITGVVCLDLFINLGSVFIKDGSLDLSFLPNFLKYNS